MGQVHCRTFSYESYETRPEHNDFLYVLPHSSMVIVFPSVLLLLILLYLPYNQRSSPLFSLQMYLQHLPMVFLASQ